MSTYGETLCEACAGMGCIEGCGLCERTSWGRESWLESLSSVQRQAEFADERERLLAFQGTRDAFWYVEFQQAGGSYAQAFGPVQS